MRWKSWGVAGCFVLFAALAMAQTRPEFEVASIRPSPEQPEQANIGVRMSGSQVRISSLSLRDYISTAYGVRSVQIDAPDWLAQSRFDIAGKLPEGVSSEKVPEMIQSLLTERFELKIHRESREFPVHALVVGKDGLKVAPAPADAAPTDGPDTVNIAGSGSAAGVHIDLGGGALISLAGNRLELRKVTMLQMADGLTRLMDRPVIDATGLGGRYDLAIDLAPEDYAATLVRSAINAGVALPPAALRALDVRSRDRTKLLASESRRRGKA